MLGCYGPELHETTGVRLTECQIKGGGKERNMCVLSTKIIIILILLKNENHMMERLFLVAKPVSQNNSLLYR